jgi:hypothetical protein
MRLPAGQLRPASALPAQLTETLDQGILLAIKKNVERGIKLTSIFDKKGTASILEKL